MDFLGETEKEFEETYDLLKEIKLYKIHVFQYSKRDGTKAAEFINQITPEIKEKRSKKIIELSNINLKEYNKEYIGKVIEVLVEEQETENFKGHTKNYMYVSIRENKSDIRNKIVKVLIQDLQNDMLIGRVKY